MLNFRRLPLLLRGVTILGLLLALASIVLGTLLLGSQVLMWGLPYLQTSVDRSRMLAAGLNLGLLSGICSLLVAISSRRSRLPDPASFPLGSWQSQLLALALLAALPVGALALTFFLAPSPQDFVLISAMTLVAAILLLVAYILVGATTEPSSSLQSSRDP
jgi:hypothetical protein